MQRAIESTGITPIAAGPGGGLPAGPVDLSRSTVVRPLLTGDDATAFLNDQEPSEYDDHVVFAVAIQSYDPQGRARLLLCKQSTRPATSRPSSPTTLHGDAPAACQQIAASLRAAGLLD